MKILKTKHTREILSLIKEIETLSHVTGQVTESVQDKLIVVEKLLSQMNEITQLQTLYTDSSQHLNKNIEDLKSLVVSKNS